MMSCMYGVVLGLSVDFLDLRPVDLIYSDGKA